MRTTSSHGYLTPKSSIPRRRHFPASDSPPLIHSTTILLRPQILEGHQCLGMADSVVQNVIGIVTQLLQQEAKVLLGVEGQVKSLAAQLNVINSFLRDSEGKRDEQQVVRELMRQIRDVALDAEDVLDDFMLAVEKQKRRNVMGKFLHGINHAARLHTVASAVDGINSTIAEIYKNVQVYGIEIKEGSIGNSNLEASAFLQRRRRDVEQENVVGLKDESDALLMKLISGPKKLDFVSIVGMGGLGKTTLARKIYNDPVVSGFFHCRAWVFVSEDYNTREVVLGIIRSVMPTIDREVLAEKTDEELREMLYKHLKSQRYLVVMDDIWKPEMWGEVKACFPDSDNQSRIMITSRKREVAVAISPSSPHFLRLLTNDEGWELFTTKVFRGEPCPPDLKDLGKKIVSRCRGLPLSIVVMAGILSKEKSYYKWSKTIDHVSSYLTEDKACVEILALSYHDLPRKLKPCFLYFAAYPEDFEVPVRQLMRLWVAEGFIQQVGDRTLEDVAEDYLETLIDRSLVQEGRLRVDGGVKTCRIHDLVRDLCISESKKEKFLETETKISSSRSTESKCRRLSLHCSTPRFVLSKSRDLSRVRSVLSFGNDDRKFSKAHWRAISEGKLLRVLDFGATIADDIPDAVEELLQLRYLSVKAPSLKVFPPSILNLWNLQTLDMRATRLTFLPIGIYELRKLRHLYLLGAVKLPEPRAKHLVSGWNLQTLSTVAPNEGTIVLVKRGLLASLTRLGLCGFYSLTDSPVRYYQSDDNSSEDASWQVLSYISHLKNLQSLKLTSDISMHAIAKYLDPKGFPSGLTKMSLTDTRLEPDDLKVIGKVPHLRILKLLEGSILRLKDIVFPEESFLELRFLYMVKLRMKSWELRGGALPRLQHLVIRECYFDHVPAEFLLKLDDLRDVDVTCGESGIPSAFRDLKSKLKDKCRIVVYPYRA